MTPQGDIVVDDDLWALAIGISELRAALPPYRLLFLLHTFCTHFAQLLQCFTFSLHLRTFCATFTDFGFALILPKFCSTLLNLGNFSALRFALSVLINLL